MQEESHKITHAIIDDEATGRVEVRFTFKTIFGEERHVDIPRERAGDLEFVNDQLMRRGADLPLDREKAAAILRTALDAPTREPITRCGSTGWRGRDFVAPHGIIGSKEAKLRLLTPAGSNPHRPREGDEGFGGWELVSSTLFESDVAVMLMAVAFAPPLMQCLRRETFAICISGAGDTGLSDMLTPAMSVRESRAESTLPDWSEVERNSVDLCRLHNGRILPVRQGPIADERDGYESFWRALLAVRGGGVPTPGGGSDLCRTILVSVADHPIDHYAERSGLRRDVCESEWCLEASAIRDGRPTVMERFIGEVEVRIALAVLREQFGRHSGKPMERFIQYLQRKGFDKAEGYHASFRDRHHEKTGLSVPCVQLLNAALVYAAGCMAIDAGILPYLKGELDEAIWRCLGSSITTDHLALEALSPRPIPEASERSATRRN